MLSCCFEFFGGCGRSVGRYLRAAARRWPVSREIPCTSGGGAAAALLPMQLAVPWVREQQSEEYGYIQVAATYYRIRRSTCLPESTF